MKRSHMIGISAGCIGLAGFFYAAAGAQKQNVKDFDARVGIPYAQQPSHVQEIVTRECTKFASLTNPVGTPCEQNQRSVDTILTNAASDSRSRAVLSFVLTAVFITGGGLFGSAAIMASGRQRPSSLRREM